MKTFPEKLAVIENHRTRRKIKNTTYAGKDLISRASNVVNSLQIVNKQLCQIDVPYLRDCCIVFYSPKKIILNSNKEILKSKINQLHSQFIKILSEHTLFSELEKIDIQISYEKETTNKKNKPQINQKTKDHINNLKKIFLKS